MAAIAGTSSAYFDVDSFLRTALSIIASVSALVSPLIVRLRLGPDEMAKWILARSKSEELKSELYFFLTRAGPYVSASDEMRRMRLCDALSEIDQNAETIVPDPPRHPSPSQDPQNLSISEYLKLRVDEQINGFYRPKSAYHAAVAERLRHVHFVLMLLGAVLGGIAATGNVEVALGPWIAVATTLASSTLAHSAAGRHEYLALTYHTTASRLEELRIKFTGREPTPENRTQAVMACEAVISNENERWHAKLLSDARSP